MKNILLVDDAAFLRMQLRHMLEKWGYRIIAEASNGEEAIRYNDLYKPDLIIMDITMPIMDGLTASRVILNNNPNSKIIMCSALGHKQTVINLYRLGVKDFIVKPFHQEKVKQALEKVFDLKPKTT